MNRGGGEQLKMSKKRGKSRKKQVAPKTKPVATTGMTRRDVIGVSLATTVVGGEILKYMPGPVQTVAVAPAAKPRRRAVSQRVYFGTPVPIQGNRIIPIRVAFGNGNVTQG